MLKGTSHKPDEEVGKMAAGAYPPWGYTVRQVADQRRDGRMQAGIFSDNSGDRVVGNPVAFELNELVSRMRR